MNGSSVRSCPRTSRTDDRHNLCLVPHRTRDVVVDESDALDSMPEVVGLEGRVSACPSREVRRKRTSKLTLIGSSSMAVDAEDQRWPAIYRCTVRQIHTQEIAMSGTHARVVQCERILRSQVESVCSRAIPRGSTSSSPASGAAKVSTHLVRSARARQPSGESRDGCTGTRA